jgi:hypothetical protein
MKGEEVAREKASAEVNSSEYSVSYCIRGTKRYFRKIPV